MRKLFLILLLFLSICAYSQDINGYGVGFRAYGQANEDIKVTIEDSEGEIFEGYDYIRFHYDWCDLCVPFIKMEKVNDLIGNDIIDFPLRSVTVKPTDTRTYFCKARIDNIHFVPLSEKEINKEFLELGIHNLSIDLKTDKPGNLFYFNEKPKGEIIFVNNILPKVNFEAKLSFYDEKNNKFADDITTNKTKINLPYKKGYCLVKYEAKFENGEIKKGEFSYGIIPNNRKISLGKTSPFGINTHFNHGKPDYFGKIVKRIGISWIRDSETSPCNDNAARVAKENDLQWMMTFSWLARDSKEHILEEIKKGKTCHDFIDCSKELKPFEECVKRHKDLVDYYDLLNEPEVNGWAVFGGDWLGGDWIDTFVMWSKQVTDIIRKNDPNAKIVWEDMHLLTYPDMIKYNAGNYFDYISPHTYSFHRVNPLPENQPWFERYETMNKILKEKGLNWKIIVGEVGTSDFIMRDDDNHIYTPTSPSLSASILLRTYVMHLTAGVEKVFWFKLEDYFNNKYDCEGNFGIVNIDGTPKPAACAYANMINILEGATFTGREKLDWTVKDQIIPPKPDRTKILGYPQFMPKDESEDNIPRFYGFSDRNKNKGYVVWVPEGSGTFTFNIGSKKVKIIDLYGNIKELNTDNGNITMYLDEYPIYIFK